MAELNKRYRAVYDDTTDEEIPSGEDTMPLSNDMSEISTKQKKKFRSRLKKYLLCKFKHSEKCASITFTFLTLGFAFILMTIIYVYAFAFQHGSIEENGGVDSNTAYTCDFTYSSNGIVKPKLDKRSYLYKELNNMLRVLVVSDPDTEYSGASLAILSGSFNEGDIRGLAHFCEHMLFLGNKKYPIPDYFSTYIAEHSGSTNAYTDLGITDYFFQVESSFFIQALDIFSNFFIEPLFAPEYVQKETNAVNSEYELNKLSDVWRIFRLLQVVSTDSHPFHHFNIGNNETLNTINIVKLVADYYNTFYKSNLMTVVMYGKEDVSTLSEIAESKFGAIPRKDSSIKTYKYPFTSLPMLVLAQALEQKSNLILVFQLPSFSEYYLQVPEFIIHLLSYPGDNSFISNLKGSRLVFDISIDTEDLVSSTLLMINFQIQEEFIYNQKWSDIIEMFFSYVHQLELIDRGEMKRLFDFWQKINQLKFDYDSSDSKNVLNIVSSLARQMQSINSTKDLLSPPCFLEFNFTFLSTEIIAQLNPTNLLVVIYSNTLKKDNQDWPNLNLTEKYFNISYTHFPINKDYILKWGNVTHGKFSLPSTSEHIPTNLEIISHPDNGFKPDLSIYENLVVWHLENTKFSKPYIKYSCSLETIQSANNIQHSTAIELYKYVLNVIFPQQLNEYQGLYKISIPSPNNFNGLILNFEGYSDQNIFGDFIDKTAKLLTNISSIADSYSYDIGYNLYQTFLTNYLKLSYTYNIVINNFKLLFFLNAYKIENIRQVLNDLTKDQFEIYLNEIYETSFLICFSYGNIDDSFSTKISKSFHQIFGSQSTKYPTSQKLTQLCSGKNYTLWQINPILHDSNSVIDVVYQLGPICGVMELGDSCNKSLLKNYVLLKLLINIMEPEFFSALRTKEQLGYLVQNFMWIQSDALFLHFLIQSPVKDPDYLESRINNFILNFKVTLESIYFETWKNIITAYSESILIEPNTFNTAFESIWSEIKSKQYQFLRNSLIKEILLTINGRDVIEFYDNLFFQTPVPRISIKLFANDTYRIPPTNQSYTVFYDYIEDFKYKLDC